MVLITKENKTYNYPINLQPSGEEFTLEVYSHMSKTTTTFTGLTGVVVDDFIGIEMTDVMLSKLPNGEYDYTVYDNDQTRVSIGLLRVDLEQQGEEDEPEYVVYHDEMDGYITIQNQDEAYEQGFTDGYDSGFTDGVDSVPLTTTGFTQNGIFRPSEGGWNEVEVNVPTGITPSGQIEITENGIYDVTEKASALVNVPTGITPSGELVISGNGIYDVVQYADVDVQVPVEDYYQSGYTSGYTTGYESGFTDGEIVGYESGFTAGYSSGETDGFESGYQSGCTDGFNTGYQSGYTDGVDSVPLVATGFTSNGTFSATTGGFNVVTVNVPTGITPSGTITIDTNGTYDVTDKASANVQIPVEDYYQSGYTSGYTDGYQSGVTDGVESGYTSGYTDGYTSGVTDGTQSGYTSGYTDGFQSGYTSGETYGFENGYSSGRTDGYNDGFDDGVDSGFTSGETYGFQVGYDSGVTDGFQSGYNSGFTDGVDSGYTSGYTSGYAEGYDNGYDDGFEDGVDSVPLNSTGFTANGTYSATTGGFNVVTVNVPTGITPTGQFAISGNGTYDITQYASVDVNVPVQDYWQSGYTSGYTDGFQSGYTSGETDGFQSGYSSGFTDGVDSGFTSGYTSGYTDGVNSVPLSTTGITSNGTYVNQNGGWNEVTVNVPSVTTQTMTQAQYDALTIKDPMVIYLING